ncbi:arsenate reductase (glutaredoxin) [Aquimarina sp. W85]|uniref:arsenate reductase (glutaredoxin) n=1 Tax=Aquimarina rhodophyticola TaxID=3342246 RepID=UPI00366F4C10
MFTIYHNPRCSKSRATLSILQEEQNESIEIVKYLDQNFTKEAIENLLTKLNIEPIELVRKNEPYWKEHYKNKELSNDEIITLLAEHPNLIERPIVVKGSKAILGRPPENVKDLF